MFLSTVAGARSIDASASHGATRRAPTGQQKTCPDGATKGDARNGSHRDQPSCGFHVLDRSFYQDPHPAYAWIRANRPIYWDDAQQLWVLSRHADIAYVSTHADLFCSGRGSGRSNRSTSR